MSPAVTPRIIILLSFLTIQVRLSADTLLAQFTGGSNFFAGFYTTNDVDLEVILSYGLFPSLSPVLRGNALVSGIYDFNASDAPDFNSVRALLTDGINESVLFGIASFTKTGGLAAGSGEILDEFRALSGCLQIPHPPECDTSPPSLGPDLVGDQINSIRLTISNVLFQNDYTTNPGSVGIDAAAMFKWEFFGTGTPLPSAVPEPTSVGLILAGIGFVLLFVPHFNVLSGGATAGPKADDGHVWP